MSTLHITSFSVAGTGREVPQPGSDWGTASPGPLYPRYHGDNSCDSQDSLLIIVIIVVVIIAVPVKCPHAD